MNFEKDDILKLIADAYRQAALDPANDMFVITELLEKIKVHLIQKSAEPYEAWNGLELDRFRYDKESILKVFVDLRTKYYNQYFEIVKNKLKDEFDFGLWFREYIHA